MRICLPLLGILMMWTTPGAAASSAANQLCKKQAVQGRVMWLDAEANLWELSTRKGVAETVKNCKAVGINTIVVDVKPLSGLVLYKSKIAPRLVQSGGKDYPADYDLLATVIDEAHKVGIPVHAAINVFSEGSQKTGVGRALEHRDWQCVEYGMDRTVRAVDGTTRRMFAASAPSNSDNVFCYAEDPDSDTKLPENTVYVRVTQEGRVIQHGIASGYARLSAPSGGYLLLGTGEAGNWLRQSARDCTNLVVEGRKEMRLVSDSNAAHNAVFVNPLHPKARAYALSVIRELCENYPIDGIVFDRMRYPNIYADFSDTTREAFEEHIGRRASQWPEDVFTRTVAPGNDVVPGPLYKHWLKFRAKVIRDFLAEAREVARSARSHVRVGIYVGSWYPLYYGVGVNWASPKHIGVELEWWPEGYEETGYADLVDYMCTGCYYANPTRSDAVSRGAESWASVEAAAEESINAVKDDTFVYGSLYLFQYRLKPQDFEASIRQCLAKTQGCMIFDLVYIRNYDWWPILKRCFSKPAKAPHDFPGLLSRLRNNEEPEGARAPR